ncbi:helix-turn-helix domain-containing protein [Lysinibacillus contaminans]|uniref:helix-turn-helix domain-containing protein n=1 Tax=Lysinibacillus contaminans TaxID=1293441 RepID=UPI0006AE8C36|nr:helix-turn-helix transcriptional regulator [Lysinibacillus contaminans]
MKNDLGTTLKNIRKSKKITQIALAKKAGVSRTYLSDVENNRYNPSISFIKSVSNGLANGDMSVYKEIYNSLMSALGYVDIQTPLEKAAFEYVNMIPLIGTCVTSIQSAQLHLLRLQKEIINAPDRKVEKNVQEKEKPSTNKLKFIQAVDMINNKESLSELISSFENRIIEDKKFISNLLTRKIELEKIISEEIQRKSNEVNESLKEIDFI